MIRSLTIGLPLESSATTNIASSVRHLLARADELLVGERFTPRTIRFTLPAAGVEAEAEGALLSRLRWVDALAADTGVRWYCQPLDLVTEGPRRERLAAALDAVTRFPRMFLNLMVASDRRIAVDGIQDAAEFVLSVSRKSNNGFDNFRVGVSCNCPPNAPFFPFSRHAGDDVAFSFALETAQLAREAVSENQSRDPGKVRDCIVEALVPLLREAHALGEALAAATGTRYAGLDASLAPLPGEVSVAAIVEEMIGAQIGCHASVFATAFLTDAIRTALAQSGARSTGFNGVMYSVLEDDRLATAVNQRRIDMDALISLSTVCACGIDMVPIPGMSFSEEVAAVMLDVAGVSCALDKPLGVRVLPIPNRRENEFTAFNLDFLCDSRVLPLTSNDRRFEAGGGHLSFRTPRT